MPVVPIEQNKTGIAGVTDAKLQPADLSGTGLQALGGGLQMLGEAGGKVADQQQAREQQQQQQAQAAHFETLKLDAAGKMAVNAYTSVARSLRDSFRQVQGFAASTALPEIVAQVRALHAQVQDGMTPEQKALIGPALGDYVQHDIVDMQAHAATQVGVEQDHQSQLVQQNAADDAVDYAANPMLAEKHIETGVDSIRLQAQLRGASPATVEPAAQQYRSGIRLRTIDKGVMGDPLGAAVALAGHRAEMTDADVAAAQQSLEAPVRQILAIGDVDRYAMSQSPSASSIAPPTAPTRDLSDLAARMRFISGQSGSGDGPDLGALAARYGGDAAKAWAAARLGPDVVDAAIKAHGDAWLGALPADTQGMVQQNMALLNAASSPRTALAADRAAFSAWLDTQTGNDGQPWSEARKQDALGEFDTRLQLAARRADAAADQAKEVGFALADQLKDGFTSITQIPPEIRRSLKPEVLAALTRQVAANLRPEPVDPGGRASLMLNLMAAQTPAAFAREDLRVWRDLVSPQEYTRFQALQQGVLSYPPSNEAMNQRNVVDQMKLHGMGLEAEAVNGGGIERPEASVGLSGERLQNVLSDDVLAENGTKNAEPRMLAVAARRNPLTGSRYSGLHGEEIDRAMDAARRDAGAIDLAAQRRVTRRSRKEIILAGGTAGTIQIADNPQANRSAPIYELPSQSEVAQNEKYIVEMSKKYRVNADLIRSIIYVESTHGYYDAPLSMMNMNNSLRPMNVNIDYWGSAWGSRGALADARSNIQGGVELLKSIINAMPGADISKIATIYNNSGAKKVSNYGARVKEVYRTKAWNEIPAETRVGGIGDLPLP